MSQMCPRNRELPIGVGGAENINRSHIIYLVR